MSEALDKVLSHLSVLVAFDTQNPPRNLAGDAPLFRYLHDALGEGFEIEVTDHGKGRVTFFARRGTPELLFNVHLDTVPVLEGAAHPPLELTLADGRACARGACDIKGAAACLLAVAQTTDHDLALLFTTDEEGGEGCCVARFLESDSLRAFRQVVVAEPTGCLAQFRHRGFLSARGVFTGTAGHSSESRALDENALHRMAGWCAEALALAQAAEREGRRTCFNIGTLGGGVKSNIIADRGDIFWSARLAPGDSNEAFLKQLFALPGAEHAQWSVSFGGPPLPTAGRDTRKAQAFAATHGLAVGDGLDFWTEASLFAEAGVPALVLGPGHIEQAHAVDEWVSLEQLERAFGIYEQLAGAS